MCGAFAVATAATDDSRAADLILVHGTILTVDPRDSVAQAIAIRDGKVLEVGTDEAILRLRAPRTRVIDLHGRTATPGLIDSHAHVADGGVEKVTDIQLGDATSIAEIVKRVRAKAAQLKPGEWIQGDGWDEGKLREHRYVLAADLDAAAPENPVWLAQTTGHYGVANSNALRLGKVNAGTPNPPAGTIDRDPTGAPRQTLNGTYGFHPFGTAEDVDIHAALRAYTAAAARQLFLEDRIGSLEPGKEADIAVWDRNLYAVAGPELKDLKCEMTLFHGKVVYRAN